MTTATEAPVVTAEMLHEAAGRKLVAYAKKDGWTNREALKGAIRYMRQLRDGDTRRPGGISIYVIWGVEECYYEAAFELHVPWFSFVPMRTDWFRAIARERRHIVYPTQGGGYAERCGSTYVFVEPPEGQEDLREGHAVPMYWDVTGPFWIGDWSRVHG